MSNGMIQFFIQKHCFFPPIKKSSPLKVELNFLPIIPIDWDFSSTKVFTLKILSLILTSALLPSTAKAADNPEGRERSLTLQTSQPHKLSTQWKRVKIKVIPTIEYWDKVAQCETANNWKNGGTWAGGLGIYTKGEFGSSSMGTWEFYGGEEFAPSPDKATKAEQIKVANRIAVLGYRTVVHRDPEWAKTAGVPATYVHHKKPVGFGGWGCIKSKSTKQWRIGPPKNWKKDTYVSLPTNKSMYCPQYEQMFKDHQMPSRLFSYIAWRESRCQPKAIGWNYKAGMNHLSCKVVTPKCHAVRSYDSGLLQINSSWKTLTSQICNAPFGDLTVLKQPECNVRVAHYLFVNTSGRLKNWSIKTY